MSTSIGEIVSGLFQLLDLVILLWCLLSWFPNIRWRDQPFRSLDMVVQPIVSPFRKIIPAGITGSIDCSPILALIVLHLLEKLVLSVIPG